MTDSRKVLITGAAGYIASLLLPVFQKRYDLVLLDISDETHGEQSIAGLLSADLHNPNMDNYRGYFEGVDTVVHLAWRRSGGPGGFGVGDAVVERRISDFGAMRRGG